MAAEYVLKEGNPNVLLCERGIRTFETAYRFTLDLTAVPVLKELIAPARDRRPEPCRRAPRRWWSRCRWRRPPPAPTGSSSRSTRSPTRRSATGRSSSTRPSFAEYAEKVERAAAIAGKVLVEPSPREDRRPRRRAHRRVRRARRARAARRRGDRLGSGATACWTRRSSAARSTAPRRSAAAALDGAEAAFVAAPVAALPDAVRAALAAAAGRTASSRTSARRSARSSRPSTTSASSAATRSRARRPPACATRAPTCSRARPGTSRRRRRTRGTLYERLHRLLVGARRAPGGARRRDARPHARGRLAPPARAGQRARRPGRAGAVGGGRAAARDRPELPRHRRAWRAPTRRSGATSTSPTPTRSSTAIDDTVARLGARPRGARRRATATPSRRGTTAPGRSGGGCSEAELAGGAVAELRVSVPNRPGVVAEVALALGQAGVNIVDMALDPAADNASGTIALWIDGERQAAAAEALLTALGHAVARA